jgi:hypothetical protein
MVLEVRLSGDIFFDEMSEGDDDLTSVLGNSFGITILDGLKGLKLEETESNDCKQLER